MFRDEGIELDDVTVFVGANSSGKTTIVDALRFMLGHEDRSGGITPWHRYDLAGKSRYNPWREPESEPRAVISVFGEYGDFTPDEAVRFDPLIRDGVLRVGGYLSERETGEPIYRPNCWVLPEDEASRLGRDNSAIGLVPAEPPFLHQGFAWVTRAGLAYRGPALSIVKGMHDFSAHLVWLPGPDHEPPNPLHLLEPIVSRRVVAAVNTLPDQLLAILAATLGEAEYDLSDRLSKQVLAVVPDTVGAVVTDPTETSDRATVTAMMQAAFRQMQLFVRLPGPADEKWDPEESVRPPGSVPAEELGSGARRALCLAAVSLYSDPELWPPDEPVLLLLEEPEAGLHASAQRAIARRLGGLRLRSGVQTVIVTHSPILIRAVGADALRITQADHAHADGPRATVYRPAGLGQIAETVGADPADVLLASRFLVVEGPSDAEVIEVWSDRLAIDLSEVRLVPAAGWSKAELITQLHRIAFPTARITVLLDGDEATLGADSRLVRLHKGRVIAHRLRRGTIEEYFSWRAIRAWLAAEGGSGRPVQKRESMRRASQLQLLSRERLGRDYDKRSDGPAIAALMREAEIAAEVRDFLVTAIV